MKALCFLASILACVLSSTTDGSSYETVPYYTVKDSPLIISLLRFGVIHVVKAIDAEHKLPGLVFNISEIYTVETKTVDVKQYYKFHALIQNEQGTIIDTVFTTRYDTQTQKKSWVSFGYDLTYVTPSVESSSSLPLQLTADTNSDIDSLLMIDTEKEAEL